MADKPEILLKVEPEELLRWARQETTQQVLEWVEECRREMQEMLSDGWTLMQSAQNTAQETAMRVGQIKGLNLIPQALQEVRDYATEKGQDDD